MARVSKGPSQELDEIRRSELSKLPEPREKHLSEIRELAYLLDNSLRIPIINYRFGIDAVLGLVPVIGDFTAFGLGGWIIYRAARMGAPRGLLVKMLANSLADTLVGSIPGLGTIVDFAWKSNARNLRMLERFLAQDSEQGTLLDSRPDGRNQRDRE